MTIESRAQDIVAKALVKVAEATLITHAADLIKLASDKDKSKEKTKFNETSPNVENPTSSHPIDNAQGELSPADTAYVDQTQAPVVPPDASGPNVTDGTTPQADPATAAAQADPTIAGGKVVVGDGDGDDLGAGVPMAITPADPGDPTAVVGDGGVDDLGAGVPMHIAPASPDQAPTQTPGQIAAEAARSFLGQEVYNAASNGNPQAMDMMARTAAQLGVAMAQAAAQTQGQGQSQAQGYAPNPADQSQSTMVGDQAGGQVVDPNVAAALGAAPANGEVLPDQNSGSVPIGLQSGPAMTADGNQMASPTSGNQGASGIQMPPVDATNQAADQLAPRVDDSVPQGNEQDAQRAKKKAEADEKKPVDKANG